MESIIVLLVSISPRKVWKWFRIVAMSISITLLCPLYDHANGFAASQPQSLHDFLQHSFQQSEAVQRSAADIDAAGARIKAALGGVLPRLEGKFTEFLQDPVNFGNSFSNSFTRLSRPEVSLTVTQPLFQGLREWYALRGAQAYRGQVSAALAKAKIALANDVVNSYFTIASLNLKIANEQILLRTLHQQLVELQRRKTLGKSREAETATATAELALHAAKLEELRGQQKVAREALAFLSGVESPNVPTPTKAPVFTNSLNHMLILSRSRPDVLMASASGEVAHNTVGATRAELLPHADVSANYYPYRVGFQRDIKWDIQFTVGIPIFSLKDISSLREAKVRAHQESLTAREAIRRAATDTRQAYARYHSALQQWKLYASAATAAHNSYNLQWKDFLNGQIDLITLLNSHRLWIEARQSRDQALIQAWVEKSLLQLAAGVIP